MLTPVAFAQSTSSVQYLANEGVMVTYSGSKVLFDPLFNNGYNNYQMVSDIVRDAIMTGKAPYDDIDAVFISHYHGDHFSAVDLLAMLRGQANVHVYATLQAVTAMREVATADDEALFARVTGLDLRYGDSPVTIEAEAIRIDAAYIPHSGWPSARTDVQNIAFRVTLENEGTVLHLGDADARDVHFATDALYWQEQQTDLALPPYWFFLTDEGPAILDDRIGARHAIGIHVPARFSDSSEIPAELDGRDLFTSPGERRTIAN
jgi:L-ascorbate metabolism protein UlaG (beta-lactamase superfamily)